MNCSTCVTRSTGPHASWCTPADRFWNKVAKKGPDDCWLWTGATTAFGHGQIRQSRTRIIFAHRFSYELHVGIIPDGLQVCHRCDVPGCVNPAHFFLGTQMDNMQDAKRKGRLIVESPRLACKRGHPLVGANVRMKWKQQDKRHHRSCRECENASRRIPGGYGPRQTSIARLS